MNIAVVGEGIIGFCIASYLSENSNNVDCISPDILDSKSLLNNHNTYNNKLTSPKLQRKDFINIRTESEKILQKKCLNFEGVELAKKMGLARFWGANLGFKGLLNDIDSLKLTKNEWNFIEDTIPFLDVQNFYEKRFNCKKNNNFLKKNKFIYSSILAIHENKIKDNSMPGFKSAKEIFGNFPLSKTKYKRINGLVIKIECVKKQEKIHTNLIIQSQDKIIKKKYDYIIIASGAIGSYRLVMNSFGLKKNKKIFDKINHHHILTTLSFIPKLPYPDNYIGMSNLDSAMSFDKINLYLNFFPFRCILDIKKYQLRKIVNKSIFIKIQIKFLKIFEKFLNNVYFVKWFVHRLYISNIYLPSEVTASYIGNNQGKIFLFGGLRSDFEKYFLKNFWSKLVKKLKMKQVYNLLVKPKSVSIGADLHYASTLSNYVKKDGTLKLKNIPKNILIVDSSSSSYLPSPNPTLFFLARAIKLVRKIKKL